MIERHVTFNVIPGKEKDFETLAIFHAVAEAGSFTHAGESLNLSQSAVSRQISALEEALAVPLFHRHARGLILTEQGETLNRTVRDVFAKLAMTEALLTESKEKPAVRLKVTTTVGFGSSWLAPRLQSFLEAYPEVSISLLLDDGSAFTGDLPFPALVGNAEALVNASWELLRERGATRVYPGHGAPRPL